MNEHVHECTEWYYVVEDDEWRCRQLGCQHFLTMHQATTKLNEHHKLKRATERLKAEIDELKEACKDDPNEMGGPFVSLSWVERTLEGK